MTDRNLIRLAAHQLDPDLFVVWLQKTQQHLGRRAGAKLLGISEDAWRHRWKQAERIMEEAVNERKDAA